MPTELPGSTGFRTHQFNSDRRGRARWGIDREMKISRNKQYSLRINRTVYIQHTIPQTPFFHPKLLIRSMIYSCFSSMYCQMAGGLFGEINSCSYLYCTRAVDCFLSIHTLADFFGLAAKMMFPVQLTTCRIGNLTRLIYCYGICVIIHVCDYTYTGCEKPVRGMLRRFRCVQTFFFER